MSKKNEPNLTTAISTLPKPVGAAPLKGSGASTVGSNKSGGKGSGSSYSGYDDYSSYGSGFGGWSTYLHPSLAFVKQGIEFWGSSRDKLSSIVKDSDIDNLSGTDLIINCTGIEYRDTTAFIKDSPDWLKLELPAASAVNQLLLDWKDMGPPPAEIDLSFWKNILRQAKANGITRIFVCCTAGVGRTGTALASLMLASEAATEPDEAIERLRNSYTKQAVETQSQELYVFNLIYDMDALFARAAEDQEDKS